MRTTAGPNPAAGAARLLVLIFVYPFVHHFMNGGVDAARRGSHLLTEESTRRRPAMSAECQFGRQLHELGSSWFADLGPPFGVMYCIRCECVSVQKKRRIVARSQCRNIKNECPKPSCEEPVLLPGRCCKVCPGDLHSPDIVQDLPSPANEEAEKNMKGFAALLTGRTSLRELDTRYVATARFNFHKKNLYYSVVHSSDMPRPRALHFLDADGNILEEQLLSESFYRNATGKACGVWWRVPRSYRQLLRDEKVHVALLTDAPPAPGVADEPRALGGSIARYKGLNTELFSSLLEAVPENPSRGAGGTAVITASSSAPSIHLSIVFNGAFSPDDVADVPLTIRLASEKHLVLDEVVRVQKPSHELNTIEVRSAVKAADLRLLARGRLQLTVSSRHHPEYKLQGDVTTRVSCDLFQATLSSVEADETAGEAADDTAPSSSALSPSSSTTTSGLAWMFLARDGALVYNVRIDDLDARLLGLSLSSGRGRRRQELEDLTPSFKSGWANGSLERLSPRELEQLYAGELSVNVATSERESLVRGRLTAHPAADPRLADAPILLKRQDTVTPASLVGLAWIAVDTECSLQYELSFSGLGNEQRPLELYLEDLPILVPGAPVSRRKLVEFYGSQLEGFAIGLTDVELARIDSGVAFLDVMDARTNTSLLRARIDKVRVPPACLPRYTDNDLPPLMSMEGANPSEPRTEPWSCYHESRFHKEGVQWRSERDVCTMCSCQHGRTVKCDPVVCPATPCSNPVKMPGDCCPSCYNMSASHESNTSETRGCYFGGGVFYRAGSSWHPYLPPVGFNRCLICSCNDLSGSLTVHCTPMKCPALTCSEEVAFRSDRNSCCKQCPASTTVSPNPHHESSEVKDQDLQDQTSPRTLQDVLDEGGCSMGNKAYHNGQEWHPVIETYGLDKCVTCRCKMGKVSCTRKKCQRPVCRKKSALKEDKCCQQCQRMRRHRVTSRVGSSAGLS